MYSALYRVARLAFYRAGLQRHRIFTQLLRSQWLPRAELDAYRLARLKELVTYAAAHVPYYQDLYRREDIHPQDLKTLQDFQALPFLTKEDVITHQEEMISPEYRGRLHVRYTGGSSGQPMRLFVEDQFYWWSTALEQRGRSWYGVYDGDKVAWVWGVHQDVRDASRLDRAKSYVLRYRFLNAVALTDEHMRDFARMCQRWQPTLFMAYPSALAIFARYVKEHNITGIRPRLIQTTAEKVSDAQRQLLQEVFQCPVADRYGSNEMGDMAYQCPQGGLHVSEEHHLEVICGGEQPAQPGEMGEVVVTPLHQYAMPFIRYQLGDLAIEKSETCSCGRGLRLLDKIVGRKNDFVVTADGQHTEEVFFDYIFETRQEVARFQVYQPDLTHLEVRVVGRKNLDAAWQEQVRQEIQQPFGDRLQVTLNVVDHIALTAAGKYRVVISDVKTDWVCQ